MKYLINMKINKLFLKSKKKRKKGFTLIELISSIDSGEMSCNT